MLLTLRARTAAWQSHVSQLVWHGLERDGAAMQQMPPPLQAVRNCGDWVHRGGRLPPTSHGLPPWRLDSVESRFGGKPCHTTSALSEWPRRSARRSASSNHRDDRPAASAERRGETCHRSYCLSLPTRFYVPPALALSHRNFSGSWSDTRCNRTLHGRGRPLSVLKPVTANSETNASNPIEA